MKNPGPQKGSKKNYIEKLEISTEYHEGCLLGFVTGCLLLLSSASYLVLVGLGYLSPLSGLAVFVPGIFIVLGAGLINRFMPKTSRSVYTVKRQVK